jgi:hypothetical protein
MSAGRIFGDCEQTRRNLGIYAHVTVIPQPLPHVGGFGGFAFCGFGGVHRARVLGATS